MLTCLIGAAARAIPAVNLTTSPLNHTDSAPAQPCGQVQHAILEAPVMGSKRSMTKAVSEPVQGLVTKVLRHQDTHLRLGS